MNFKNILFDKLEHIALITLNRQDKLNALNNELFNELNEAISNIELDKDIQFLILTGSGDKAFAAGADIKELHDAISCKQFSEHGSKVMARLEQLSIPVVAAINGFALGGGLELALACHIRFASDKAKFGQPEVNLGIIPGYGATQRLPRIIGKAKSMELILSAKTIDPQTAKEIGLVNDVFPHSELMSKTFEFANLVLSKSPIAVSAAVDCINASEQLSLQEGLAFESRKFGDVGSSADFKEGTEAFLEKRQAKFIGK
ncbi:MAG: enoyl-CoA hydratase-related protein [Chloroherpetonaceae bacterium]|nr:enoyl-CoA hydratase/isomerase family protein [bacterium]